MTTNKHIDCLDFELNSFDGDPFSPKDLDIEQIAFILEIAKTLFNQKDRPHVSFEIKEGSAVPSFYSEKRFIHQAKKNITPEIKRKLTAFCFRSNLSLNLKSSTQDSPVFSATPLDYIPPEGFSVTGGAILRGEVKLVGGDKKFHITLKSNKTSYKIACTREQLEDIESNPLFALYEVEVSYKLNSESGIIDPKSYTLNHIKPFEQPQDGFLESCIDLGTQKWGGTGQEWLNSLRYGEQHTS